MTEPTWRSPETGWQPAIVTRIDVQTARIKSFWLEPKRAFHFLAGQHVDLKLTADSGYFAWRSYSIASSPDRTSAVEIAVDRLDDGEVSPFLHDILSVGDEIELRGPLGGHFTWTVADGGPLLLVGGGSGVAPLASMVRARSTAHDTTPVALLLAARTWEDVLFRDELIDLDARSDGLRVVLALSRDQPRRASDYGRRVDESMLREVRGLLSRSPTRVFVCGANGFVGATVDGLVAAGMPPGLIRTERYGA